MEENKFEENNFEETNAEEINAEEVNAEETNAEEVNAEEVNAEETNAEKPKKKIFSMKKLKRLIAIILIVVMVVGAGAAIYANFIAMPNPITALAKTMDKKYQLDTNFDFGKLEKQGKFLLEAKFDEELYPLPGDILSVSASYKKDQVGILANIFGEEATVNFSKKDMSIAAAIEGMNDGQAYGFSLKDFREHLSESVFAPDSESAYLDEQTFELLCYEAEILAMALGDKSDESKQTKKDMETISKFLTKTFKKSELGKTEKNYSSLEVLGEKRSARNKTYTLNQDTLDDFLDLLYKNMKNASKKVSSAGDRLCETMSAPISSYFPGDVDVDWDFLTEQLGELKDDIDIGDLEVKITVAYKYTNVTAIVIEAESHDMNLEGTLTLDLGEKPVKDMNTIIDLDAVYQGVKIEGRITVEDNSEKLLNDITVKGTLKIGPMEYAARVRLVLDTKGEKASLKAEYSTDGSFRNMQKLFDLKCKYVDTKDEWSLSFTSITVGGQTYKAKDLGISIKLAFYRQPDDIYKMPEYEDILDWKDNSKLEEFVGKFEEFASGLLDRFGLGATMMPDIDSDSAPNSDPDLAYEALTENGYEAYKETYTDDPEGMVATLSATKSESDMIMIVYYKDEASAIAAFESAQGTEQSLEETFGVDYICARSGKMVYLGTQSAINAAN